MTENQRSDCALILTHTLVAPEAFVQQSTGFVLDEVATEAPSGGGLVALVWFGGELGAGRRAAECSGGGLGHARVGAYTLNDVPSAPFPT